MRPKLAGLPRRDPRRRHVAHIVDGRVPHSLLLELFTDAGIGTKIRAGVSLAELQASSRAA